MTSNEEPAANSAGAVERALSEAFFREAPQLAARVIEKKTTQEIAAILTGVDAQAAGELLRELNQGEAASCLQFFPQDFCVSVIETLGADEASALLRFLPKSEVKKILEAVSSDLASVLRSLLQNSTESAGAVMTSQIFVLNEELDVSSAWELVKTSTGRLFSEVCVVTRDGTLIGILSLERLMRQSSTQKIVELMDSDSSAIDIQSDARTIVSHPGWERSHTLPVVDKRNRLAGVITYRTWRRLCREYGPGARPAPALAPVEELTKLYCAGLTGAVQLFGGLVGSFSGSSPKKEREYE